MFNSYIALENIRSLYNVGSILRSASFFGIKNILLVGYSGKTILPNGKAILSEKISKTALTSEVDVNIIMIEDVSAMHEFAETNKLKVVAIEQASNSKPLIKENLIDNALYVLGNEVEGVTKITLTKADKILEIKHEGGHNSLNVSVTAGVLFNVLTS